MQALIAHGRELHLESVPDPEIRDPRDVVVRMTGSSICRSVAVIGLGPIGIMAVELAYAMGPAVGSWRRHSVRLRWRRTCSRCSCSPYDGNVDRWNGYGRDTGSAPARAPNPANTCTAPKNVWFSPQASIG